MIVLVVSHSDYAAGEGVLTPTLCAFAALREHSLNGSGFCKELLDDE